MSSLFVLLVVLLEGFVTISVEILVIRQLMPLVGNSVVVTSLIIAVFLLFLAYGYRRGGQYGRDFAEILKRNFTISACLLGVGLSYIFIYLFFINMQKLSSEVLLSLSVYLLMIIAPLVYFLGQTLPITMNLIKQNQSAGAIGGKILHLSTIGSFFGAVLTSLVLMHYLGVAKTVVINFQILFLLIVLLTSKAHIKRDIIRIIALSLVFLLVYRVNVHFEDNTLLASNAYANYELFEDDSTLTKALIINGSLSSVIDRDGKAFPYIELIRKILFSDLKLQGKDILVLGAGGFTLSMEGTNKNNITYVDVDKSLPNIVKQHFAKEIHGKVIIKDARDFLNTSANRFDAIVSDVYSSHHTVPAHLLTREYFLSIKDHLHPEGTGIFNIMARPFLDDAYSKRIDNTIRSVFSQCLVIPLNYTANINNLLYVCRKSLEGKTSDYYTDNINRATLDFFVMK